LTGGGGGLVVGLIGHGRRFRKEANEYDNGENESGGDAKESDDDAEGVATPAPEVAPLSQVRRKVGCGEDGD
jgi:hypothetical protein